MDLVKIVPDKERAKSILKMVKLIVYEGLFVEESYLKRNESFIKIIIEKFHKRETVSQVFK